MISDPDSRRERRRSDSKSDSVDYSNVVAPARSGRRERAEFQHILFERQNWVATVTINRPSVYNTYTDETLREMAAAFREAAADNSIAVIVLTGSGEKAFSAGADVQQIEHLAGDPTAAKAWIDCLLDAHAALREADKPSIARINGMAAGGGNEWVLACDLAIAADHARFIQVENQVGLVPSAGAAQWLSLAVGERRAREVLLTGEPISANKALLWGLVNDVVPYKQLDKAVNALCQKLIDKFGEAQRNTRRQLGFWKDLTWNSILRDADQSAVQLASEEASLGLKSLTGLRQIDFRALRGSKKMAESKDVIAEPEPLSPATEPAPTRECYSCGAVQIPSNYSYCGFCGTRLL